MFEQIYIKKDGKFVPVEEFAGFPSNGVWLVKDGLQNLIYKLDYKDTPPFYQHLKGLKIEQLNMPLLKHKKMEKIFNNWRLYSFCC